MKHLTDNIPQGLAVDIVHKQRYAKIWVNAPDVLDGFFVEILERVGKKDFQTDAKWFATVDICYAWAMRKGIDTVYEQR